MTDDDVPDLIAALAERFHDYGFASGEAIAIASDMLREAMDDPETCDLQILSPYLN